MFSKFNTYGSGMVQSPKKKQKSRLNVRHYKKMLKQDFEARKLFDSCLHQLKKLHHESEDLSEKQQIKIFEMVTNFTQLLKSNLHTDEDSDQESSYRDYEKHYRKQSPSIQPVPYPVPMFPSMQSNPFLPHNTFHHHPSFPPYPSLNPYSQPHQYPHLTPPNPLHPYGTPAPYGNPLHTYGSNMMGTHNAAAADDDESSEEYVYSEHDFPTSDLFDLPSEIESSDFSSEQSHRLHTQYRQSEYHQTKYTDGQTKAAHRGARERDRDHKDYSSRQQSPYSTGSFSNHQHRISKSPYYNRSSSHHGVRDSRIKTSIVSSPPAIHHSSQPIDSRHEPLDAHSDDKSRVNRRPKPILPPTKNKKLIAEKKIKPPERKLDKTVITQKFKEFFKSIDKPVNAMYQGLRSDGDEQLTTIALRDAMQRANIRIELNEINLLLQEYSASNKTGSALEKLYMVEFQKLITSLFGDRYVEKLNIRHLGGIDTDKYSPGLINTMKIILQTLEQEKTPMSKIFRKLIKHSKDNKLDHEAFIQGFKQEFNTEFKSASAVQDLFLEFSPTGIGLTRATFTKLLSTARAL